MKRKLILSLFSLMLVLAFSACSLNGQSNYSPKLMLVNPATLNLDSAFYMSYTQEGNVQFDSALLKNDTITLFVYCDGFVNNLINLDFNVEKRDDIEILEIDSLKNDFDPTSDFIGGKIILPKDIVRIKYPFKFVAKKVSEKLTVQFTLISDAVNVPNKATIQLEFKIKEK